MDDTEQLTHFERVLAARAAKKAEQEQFKAAKEGSSAPDLIPEVQFDRTVEDDLIDGALKRVSVIEAYEKWCGKMQPARRAGQTEGVMISCPIPGHRDSNPSAWANTEKDTWFCARCQQGGDIYDIAAYYFNLPVPGYKSGKSFHDLRRSMVQDLGYVVQKATVEGQPDNIYLPVPEPVAPVVPAVAPVVSVDTVEASIERINDALLEAETDLDFIAPEFDWRAIVPEGTFLHDYINACIVDDAAEEYHFWNGLVAIGVAVGRSITLYDSLPVYANIMLCILGQSGDRKSRSMSHMKNLIRESLPYEANNPVNNGVRMVQGAASGEAIISVFQRLEYDPTDPKRIVGPLPVRALIDYSELSDLVGRAARQGSVIKTVLMQVADTDRSISTVSVTRGEVVADKPFGCVVTTTQPESLKDLVSEGDTTSGFLNRWIFASGKPKTKVAIGGAKVDMLPVVDAYKRIHGQVPREIQWTEGAAKLFTEHFHSSIEPVQHNNPVLGRLDLIEKKLILLLAINSNLDTVSEEIVHQVIMMHSYLVKVYGITSKRIQKNSINTQIHAEIMRHIERLTVKFPQFGPSKKQLKDCVKHKGWDPVVSQRILELIAKDEQVEVSMGDPSKPGRKTEHYKWLG